MPAPFFASRASGSLVGLMSRVLAPLAVEVHARIAGIIRRRAIAALLAPGTKALERRPRLDQRPVHRKVLVAGQLQLAGLCYRRAENSPATSCSSNRARLRLKLEWSKPRLVPVQIQEPAEQKVVIQLLAKHPLTAHRVQRHQERGFQQPLRRNRGSPHITIHLLEQRREFFEHYISQRLISLIGWLAGTRCSGFTKVSIVACVRRERRRGRPAPSARSRRGASPA